MAEFFPIPPLRTTSAASPLGAAPASTAAGPALAGSLGRPGGSSIVQLSGYGQMLSSVAGFQTRLDSLRPQFASGASADFVADVGRAAAGAQGLADAFNGVQGRMTDLGGIFAAPAGRAGLTQGFQQTLNAQASAAFANGDSIFTSLGRIGINFQPPAVPGTGGTLSVDLEALRNALTFDASGTFALLAQATQSLADAATRFAGQTGSAATAFGLLAQMQAAQMAMAAGEGGAVSDDLNGFSDQAALALIPGDATGVRQRAIALNQFNRIAAFY